MKSKISALVVIALVWSQVLTVNHCSMKQCTTCSKIGEDYSCDECVYSKRVAVNGTKLFKCEENIEIDHCVQLEESS